MLLELEIALIYGSCDIGPTSARNIKGECLLGWKGLIDTKITCFLRWQNQGTGEQLAYPKSHSRAAASSLGPHNLTSSPPVQCLLPAFPSMLSAFSSRTNYKGITLPRPNSALGHLNVSSGIEQGSRGLSRLEIIWWDWNAENLAFIMKGCPALGQTSIFILFAVVIPRALRISELKTTLGLSRPSPS